MKLDNKLKKWMGYFGVFTAIAQILRFLIGLTLAVASMKWDVIAQFFKDAFRG